MPKEKAIEAQYAMVTEAHEGHREALFAKENVVGVAAGHKIEEGKDTDEICVTVFISQKLDRKLLKVDDLVPETVGGFKTDIVETGEIFAEQSGGVAMKEELGIEVLKQRVRPASRITMRGGDHGRTRVQPVLFQ